MAFFEDSGGVFGGNVFIICDIECWRGSRGGVEAGRGCDSDLGVDGCKDDLDGGVIGGSVELIFCGFGVEQLSWLEDGEDI